MSNQFQRANAEVANAATLAVEPLRKALINARVAFVAAKRHRDRLEAEYIQAWNKAASAAARAEQQQDDADALYRKW